MIAVIIVTFGRLELTRQTLETLFASNIDRTAISVTVVDNHSQKPLIDLLLSYRDRIDNLVLLQNNRGKPYAWNLGAAAAQEQCLATKLPTPSHLLFCDNDLIFTPNWLPAILAAYEEFEHLPLCGLSGMRWPAHALDGLQQGANSQINVVRFPPGCCVLMSAEAFKANGPWDTARLIRTVDTRYFRNARNRGWVNASIHPASVIEHAGRLARSWHIQTGDPKLID